ncbi:MAG TPA: methylated-DNA--[protein]-cysteine S-methyltransferase [Ramlibacter sp.]|jgi:methylated-DNA-[protein]-cysteine S-methyltransferase|uniref:methylated-DNA--[protein]-cysteine S-methyltransferase n=1 Tax=Ramlibacter sp. TaxID=1917967 RepID=UPI002D339B8B|nr:methylated-DNA--[protein]-cysteine S-methyltransferase [Ramlibacter sp.]HZY18546.1 methylated-DNA--[protein]-cysteine S-methyltransferase [Ramlibacter sp.]
MAVAAGCCLFDTAVGRCGIAWTPAGAIQAVQLPEADEAGTLVRLQRRCGAQAVSVPPPPVRDVIARLQSALAGRHDALLDVPIDWVGVAPFARRVYEAARAIAPGQVRTYGELARALGEPGAARAVGQALGHNPFAPLVPCHRILAARGAAGGFSAEGGTRTKLRLLEIEGAALGGPDPGLFD